MNFITPENAWLYMLASASLAVASLLSFFRSKRNISAECEKLRRQVRKQPRSFQPRYAYALSLYGEGKLDSAETELREAILLNPRHAQAHVYLGKVLLMQGDEEAAAAHFEKATVLSPLYAEAFSHLGSAREKKGDLLGAEGAYLRAVVLDPKLGIAQYNLARLYATCFEPAKAVKHLREAILANELFKREAKSCGDFDRICNSAEFQDLVYGKAA